MPSDWGLSNLPSDRDLTALTRRVTGGGRTSDLVINEYSRFVTGLAGFTPAGEEAARVSMARRIPTEDGTRYINVPGWDDVIRLSPRERLTRAELDGHRAARAKGAPSPLGEDRLLLHGENLARMKAMQNAATPEYAKNWAQIVTALDNVQDLLSTVATAGRLVLNPIARLALHEVGPASGLLLRSGVMAGRLASRAIPGLGWILLAGDLINLLNLAATMMFPAYAMYCGGAPQAVAASLPAMLMKRMAKRKLSGFQSINPFSRVSRYKRWQRATTATPSIYNLLEVAQTTDALFGVGLSYGGIWGVLGDSAFAAEQARRGIPVGMSTPTGRREYAQAYADRMRQFTRPELRDARVAANVLATAPLIARVQDVFTPEEHLEHMAAVTVAFDLLRPFIADERTPEYMQRALELEWAPPAWSPWGGLEYQAAHGFDVPQQLAWALPGSPAAITGEAYMQQTAAEIPGALLRLMAPIRAEYEGSFAGALVVQIVERTSTLITGSADPIKWKLSPDAAVLESFVDAGVHPHPAVSEEALWRLWRACTDTLADTDRGRLWESELRALAQAADVPLLTWLPAEAPFPPDLVHVLHGTSGR